MYTLNLLPEQQSNQQKQLTVLLSISIVMIGLIIIFYRNYINHKLYRQTLLHQHVQQKINSLDKQIIKLKNISAQRRQLLQIKNLFDKLQHRKHHAIKVYCAIANIVPKGIQIKQIDWYKSRFEISGLTASIKTLSSLLHGINQLPWTTTAEIKKVVTIKSHIKFNHEFIIIAHIKIPQV